MRRCLSAGEELAANTRDARLRRINSRGGADGVAANPKLVRRGPVLSRLHKAGLTLLTAVVTHCLIKLSSCIHIVIVV